MGKTLGALLLVIAIGTCIPIRAEVPLELNTSEALTLLPTSLSFGLDREEVRLVGDVKYVVGNDGRLVHGVSHVDFVIRP